MTAKPSEIVSASKLAAKPVVDPDELKKMLVSAKDSSDYWQGRWHLWQAKRQKARGQLAPGGA
ncbi:MAG: hypothetical protein HYS86_04745 [Candidatus Chisholmbacteria bacterium]|nr:hypothetical protein [Candidatus Chisholmbacteria bacterium]